MANLKKNQRIMHSQSSASAVKDSGAVVKYTPKEIALLIGILETLSQSRQMEEYLQSLITHLRQYSGCSCVGIRILDDEGNIPYKTLDGFSQEFYESENFLSIKVDKCMCINVMNGNIDPALPYYTTGGSFLSNSTTELLATTPEEMKGETRNVCNACGYESLALIPMNHKGKILGLIHLADDSTNKIPLKKVQFLESVGTYIGQALHTFITEKALGDSEEHYSALVGNLAEAVFKFKGGVVIWCNEAVEKIYGYTSDELIGVKATFLYPEDISPQDLSRELSASIRKEGVYRGTAKFRRKDGTIIYIEYSISQIPDKNPVELVAIARDITGRKQAEQERQKLLMLVDREKSYAEKLAWDLKQEKDMLQVIMENTYTCLAYLDPQFNFLRVNSAYAKDSGHTIEELMGRNHFDLFPNEENQRIFETVRDTGETVEFLAKPYQFEDQPWRGTTYWDWTLIPVKDSSGIVQGLVLSVVDVTERKLSEEALRSERDNLINILEAMKDGVYIMGGQYNIDYVNHALRNEFGSPEGKKCYEYFHNRNESCPWCKNQNVFKGESVRWEWYSEKNGRTYDIIDTPLRNPDGSMSKLEILRDITEHRKTDQLKDEFIGMVSHELRTPLTVIIGAVHTALTEDERLSSEERRQLLQDASSEAESLSHLLGNLLELSRAQADRLFLHVEPIDIETAIETVVDTIRQRYASHRFLTNFPKKKLPMVHADELRVERILYNLLENAVKYSPQDSKIRVFAKATREHIVIGVSDRGPGISDADRDKLFGAFQRLENATLHMTKGIGLGLLVCRRLAEAHNGQIWVESEVGKGTIFYFTLPLTRPVD